MIKNYLKSIALGASLFLGLSASTQTISTFDNETLDSTGYWIGDSIGDGFVDGEATFVTDYDTSWGGYWSAGFALSNHTDISTAGFTNNYSSYAGSAHSGSQFSVVDAGAFDNSRLWLDTSNVVSGFYISNTTYAALSMRDGDDFAKAFGADTLPDGSDTTHTGAAVTGADWFKLTVIAYHGDSLYADEAIDYYLADYRFADDTQDYIVKDWQWVDLTSLGEVDGLNFVLSSSDEGSFGMNTPSYFCMDDLTVGDILEGLDTDLENLVSIYPNPANDVINLKVRSNNFEVVIFDYVGRILINSTERSIDVSELNSGVYFVSINVEGAVYTEKIIKK